MIMHICSMTLLAIELLYRGIQNRDDKITRRCGPKNRSERLHDDKGPMNGSSHVPARYCRVSTGCAMMAGTARRIWEDHIITSFAD